jgi:hypothetical protein
MQHSTLALEPVRSLKTCVALLVGKLGRDLVACCTIGVAEKEGIDVHQTQYSTLELLALAFVRMVMVLWCRKTVLVA